MSAEGPIAVDRALTLLMSFRAGDGALTLAELAKRTGLNKSTILRLAASLQKANLLVKLPAGGFRLGGRILTLAAIFREPLQIDHEARPRLAVLAAESGESASFYLLDGDMRICVARIEGPQSIRDATPASNTLPLAGDNTATGRVLRRLSGKKIGSIKGPFAPIFTTGIRIAETASLCSPVLGGRQTLIGALTLSGPAFRLTSRSASRLAEMLANAARDFSATFGWNEKED